MQGQEMRDTDYIWGWVVGRTWSQWGHRLQQARHWESMDRRICMYCKRKERENFASATRLGQNHEAARERHLHRTPIFGRSPVSTATKCWCCWLLAIIGTVAARPKHLSQADTVLISHDLRNPEQGQLSNRCQPVWIAAMGYVVRYATMIDGIH